MFEKWQNALEKRLDLIELAQKAESLDFSRDAGSRAERDVVERLEESLKKRNTKFRIFTGKRIPTGTGSGRYEVDIIVVTPSALLMVEVKNWSGRLDVQGDSWKQTTTIGKTRSHRNPLGLLETKKSALQKYLNQQGAALAPEHIFALVVMANQNLRVERHRTMRSPSRQIALTSLPDLDQSLDSIGLTKQPFLSDWIPFFGDIVSLRKVESALKNLPTWDTLHFFGGFSMSGDLVMAARGEPGSLRFGGAMPFRPTRVNVLVPRKPRHLLRPCRIEWREGLRPVAKPIDPMEELRFLPAGEPNAIGVPWYKLETIELGGMTCPHSLGYYPHLRPPQR